MQASYVMKTAWIWVRVIVLARSGSGRTTLANSLELMCADCSSPGMWYRCHTDFGHRVKGMVSGSFPSEGTVFPL